MSGAAKSHWFPLTLRQFGLIGLFSTLVGLPTAMAPSPAFALAPGSEDSYATGYYQLLLKHTNWMEASPQFDGQRYTLTNNAFTGVFGNAVLLNFGTYDPVLAGVSAVTLRTHTVDTITAFAASNRWIDPTNGTWGKTGFFDITFEAYFVAAARLMWADLDSTTRTRIDTIIRSGANRAASLGTSEESTWYPPWTSNGLIGGWRGDSKIEEMGNKTMMLAAALAYHPTDPNAGSWLTWFNKWMLNMNGLPSADEANTTVIDGQSIATWATARNVYTTFMVENHGSMGPIYQQSAGAYPGRNLIQFLIAGQPIPSAVLNLPNDDALWLTLDRIGTDAGVPEDFMVADRHHLYGRNVLPIAYRSIALGDRFAQRAEQMLLDHLPPYQDYPPQYRLTKFSGQANYEPEARIEIAMAYLLHYWRAQLTGNANPVSTAEYFAGRASTTDYGPAVGLVAQQGPNSLTGTVTKKNSDVVVKFSWLPQHDDWLFDVSGTSPSFIPGSSTTVQWRNVRLYRNLRDGFDGTATIIQTPNGYAGFATLPNGSAVYTTTGLAANEGELRLYNLSMPGVSGLDGNRTFTAANGTATLSPSGTGTFTGNWLNVDGRAGFVIRHVSNPISVTGTSVVLSQGSASSSDRLVVEAYPGQTAAQTQATAALPEPTGGTWAVRVSLTSGYLSMFNLGEPSITNVPMTIPVGTTAPTLFAGTQTTQAGGTSYSVNLAGAEPRIEPPRFTLQMAGGGSVPAGLLVMVSDSQNLSVNNTTATSVSINLTSVATGEVKSVTVAAGATIPIAFTQGTRTPANDAAYLQPTYPTSPLPPGMTGPQNSVDRNGATAWTPGAASGRMLVDLGRLKALSTVQLDWTVGTVRGYTLSGSYDGISYTQLATSAGGSPSQRISLPSSRVRFLSVQVSGWTAGDAGLASLIAEVSTNPAAITNGNGGVDEVRFGLTSVRWVRMLGVHRATQYGYSLYGFEVHRGQGPDLAEGVATTASSFNNGQPEFGGPFGPELATDGDTTSRWAVSVADRLRNDSWIAVDLGVMKTIDRVILEWESAYGDQYKIQVSNNNVDWVTVATVN
jgi:F5/8 type C domain